MVVDKEQKGAVVIDGAIPADNNTGKKEQEKIPGAEAGPDAGGGVVPVATGALGAVTPPKNWKSGSSRIQVQQLRSQDTVQNPQTPQASGRGPELQEIHASPMTVRGRFLFLFYIKKSREQSISV